MTSKTNNRGARKVRHDIWSNASAQGCIAHLAMLATTYLNGCNPGYMPLLKQVAEFALSNGDERLSKILFRQGVSEESTETPKNLEDASEEPTETPKNLDEKFRNFVRRLNGRMEDTKLLDQLARFLLSNGNNGFRKRNGLIASIWDKQVKNALASYDVKLAIKDLEDGHFGFDDQGGKRDYAELKNPPNALMSVAFEHFGTSAKEFSEASLSLTGWRKVDGKAGFDQKGYWACYRFSAENPGQVVKSRFVITPPEDEYDYCRFQHYLSDADANLRKSEGLVLPVGERVYLIGTIGTGENNAGLKAICLENPKGSPTKRKAGLVMSNSSSGARSPIISKLIVIRERAEYASVEKPAGRDARRDDLNNFNILPIDDENITEALGNFYKGSLLDDILKESKDKQSEHLTSVLETIENSPRDARERIKDANALRLLELAIQL